jgi:hypothetical protein
LAASVQTNGAASTKPRRKGRTQKLMDAWRRFGESQGVAHRSHPLSVRTKIVERKFSKIIIEAQRHCSNDLE